jgi:hypothetical protein
MGPTTTEWDAWKKPHPGATGFSGSAVTHLAVVTFITQKEQGASILDFELSCHANYRTCELRFKYKSPQQHAMLSI